MAERLIDLAAEAARAGAAMTGHRLAWLKALGFAEGIVQAGLAGTDRIRLLHHGLYEPADAATEGLILPVWSGAPSRSEIVDLIALPIGGPQRWASRCGVSAILGEWQIPPLDDAPVRVFLSPWTWLRHGAAGICIVGPLSDAREALLGLPAIAAESVEAGRTIDAELKRLPRTPRILVPTVQARAA